MTTTYNRVTSAGYNTGKVIIGSCYMPKPRKMNQDEHEIQDLLLTRTPVKRVFRDAARRLALWVSKGIGKAQQIAQRAGK